MDLMDTIKSALDGGEGSGKPDLMSVITGLIGGGGLNGLIKMFTEKGLGDIVSSWVGKGDNTPVTPEQVKDVFGENGIDEIATKTGMDKDEVTGQLSDLLPKAVDKVTPEGKVPEEGPDPGKITDLLGGLFGK